ncbi:MAG: type II toxin-antitoxin system CcdA family antitoxin [Egibacteraceae bacterium]
MPKISVYLSDDLYRAARDEQLAISALAQEAIEAALRARSVDRWIEQVRARPARTHRSIDAANAVAAAREEFGA